MKRRRLGRFLHRRRFYGQVPRRVAARVLARRSGCAAFVTLMGRVGDLVAAVSAS